MQPRKALPRGPPAPAAGGHGARSPPLEGVLRPGLAGHPLVLLSPALSPGWPLRVSRKGDLEHGGER